MVSKLSVLLAITGAHNALAQIPGLMTPVSADTFNRIVKYTNYAAATYGTDCPTPPSGSSIINSWGGPTSGTRAQIFYSASQNEIVLSWKGTSFPDDFTTDFTFGLVAVNIAGTKCTNNCQVHQGFQTAYNSISAQVVPAVKAAVAKYPKASLYVTGHSLGGALASLATAQLAAQGLKFTTFTYGEPRNGNQAWSSYVDSLQSNYFRVTHFNDGVPNLPPTILGYAHHGTEYWEKANTTNSASTTYNCGKGDPLFCNLSQNSGSNPINGAHIQYSNILVAPALFNPGCGYVQPS